MTDSAPTNAPADVAARTAPLGPRFRQLWTAATVSNLGDGVDLTAIPLLAALLTRDPVLFAGVTAAAWLPWLVFSLYAGALADRWDRKSTMVWMNAGRCLLLVLLGVAVVGGWATIWLLYVIAFCLGIAETLFDTAAQAFVPALVSTPQLERANKGLYVAETLMLRTAGPPLGGLLFAVAAALPMFADAGTFAISATLILSISGRYRAGVATQSPATSAEPARRRIHAEIAEGVRWVWRNSLVRTIALLAGLINGMSAATLAILPLFAIEILDLHPRQYGLLFLCVGVGNMVVTPFVGRIVDRFGRGTPMTVCLAGFAICTFIQGISSNAVVVGALAVVFGGFMLLWNVIAVSRVQAITPNEMLGRVTSVMGFLAWGSMTFGALVGGLLASTLGLRAPMLISSVIWMVAMLLTARVIATADRPAVPIEQPESAP